MQDRSFPLKGMHNFPQKFHSPFAFIISFLPIPLCFCPLERAAQSLTALPWQHWLQRVPVQWFRWQWNRPKQTRGWLDWWVKTHRQIAEKKKRKTQHPGLHPHLNWIISFVNHAGLFKVGGRKGCGRGSQPIFRLEEKALFLIKQYYK